MNNIAAYIDQIAEKFGYDEELVSQLKRVVPIMTEGKSEEVKNMLFDTLDRVKIFVIENDPTREDVENIALLSKLLPSGLINTVVGKMYVKN